MNTQLAKVLFSHRIMPQTTTGVSPAELLIGTRPRTRLDLLHPNTAKRVEQKQYQQKQQHDSKAKAREFKVGNTVLVKTYGGGGCRWLPGTIIQFSGPGLIQVQLKDGRVRQCHQDQIHQRVTEDNTPEVVSTQTDSTIPSNWHRDTHRDGTRCSCVYSRSFSSSSRTSTTRTIAQTTKRTGTVNNDIRFERTTISTSRKGAKETFRTSNVK